MGYHFLLCNIDSLHGPGITCTQGEGTVPYRQLLAVGQLQLGLICVEPNKILIIFY